MDYYDNFAEDFEASCYGCGKTVNFVEGRLISSDPFYPGVDEVFFCKQCLKEKKDVEYIYG